MDFSNRIYIEYKIRRICYLIPIILCSFSTHHMAGIFWAESFAKI